MQQISLAALQELGHLRGLDRALQDHPPGAKVATAAGAHRFFADIGRAILEYPMAAFRTRPERRAIAEVRPFAFLAFRRRAEVELHFERVIELDRGRERPPHLAAKTVQRSHFAA